MPSKNRSLALDRCRSTLRNCAAFSTRALPRTSVSCFRSTRHSSREKNRAAERLLALEPTMFREYDIRGRETDEELSPAAVRAIGRGYGEFLRRRGIQTLVVGRDSRRTSEELQQALIEG